MGGGRQTLIDVYTPPCIKIVFALPNPSKILPNLDIISYDMMKDCGRGRDDMMKDCGWGRDEGGGRMGAEEGA